MDMDVLLPSGMDDKASMDDNTTPKNEKPPAFIETDNFGVNPGLGGRSGFLVRTRIVVAHAEVAFFAGRAPQNKVPTPATPEVWRIGFIQNVLMEELDVFWKEDGEGEKHRSFRSRRQMCDAVPGMLPFVSPAVSSKQVPCWDVVYDRTGLRLYNGPEVVNPWDSNPNPALNTNPWGNVNTNLDVRYTDSPFTAVFAFLHGGPSLSKNSLLEFRRKVTLKFWLAAVPLKADLNSSHSYHVLARSSAFTLSATFRRRNMNEDVTSFDRFNVQNDTGCDPDYIPFLPGGDGTLPVVTTDPMKLANAAGEGSTFLRGIGFAA
jgi:hypothetical protein